MNLIAALHVTSAIGVLFALLVVGFFALALWFVYIGRYLGAAVSAIIGIVLLVLLFGA